MVLPFFNRQGDRYYIRSKLTKKGNTTYFMTKKEDEGCLDSLPAGYEVFEKPDTGMMFIRQIKKSNYKAEEIQIVKMELKKNESLEDFIVDIVGNEIKIYVAEKEDNERLSLVWEQPFISKLKTKEFIKKFMKFEEQMRIIKKSTKEANQYEFQRYCYRGSIDDWISIDSGENLQKLASENIYHLGKESYFDLF